MKKFYSLALILIALGLLACVPYFFYDYGVHNDYRALDHAHIPKALTSISELLWHDESMHLVYIGRPINAILFNLQQYTINDLLDLKIWRVVSCLTLLAATLNFAFVSISRAKNKGFWIAFTYFLIYLAPPSQLYINWISNYVPGSLNILVVSFAAIFLSYDWKQNYLKYFCFLLAVLTLIVSNFNYPATSSAIIIPSIVSYFYKPNLENYNYLKRSVYAYLIALVLYYILHKFYLFDYMGVYFADKFKSYDENTYKFGIGINFNAISVILELLIAWITSIFYAKWKVASILLLLCMVYFIGAKTYIWNQIRKHSYEKVNASLRKIFKLTIFTVLLTIAPIIVAPNGFFAYRVFFTPIAIGMLFFSYGVYCIYLLVKSYCNISRIKFLIIASSLFAVNGFMQNHAYTMQSFTEFQFVKDSIESAGFFNKIIVVFPKRYCHFAQSDLSSDLNYTATNYSGFMKSVVYFVTDPLGIKRDSFDIEIANAFYSDGYTLRQKDIPDGAVLIDMHILQKD